PLTDGSHLTLLAETVAGYANLSRLITAAYDPSRQVGKSASRQVDRLTDSPTHRLTNSSFRLQPRLDPALLAEHAGGLVLLTGCRRGALSRLIDDSRWGEARALLDRYVKW